MQINHVKKSDLPNRLECIMRWTYTYTPLYVHVETTHTKKDVSQEILLLKLYFSQPDLLKYFPHYLLLSCHGWGTLKTKSSMRFNHTILATL